MRRPVLRALVVVVGFSTLVAYLAGAYLAYLLVATERRANVHRLRKPYTRFE